MKSGRAIKSIGNPLPIGYGLVFILTLAPILLIFFSTLTEASPQKLEWVSLAVPTGRRFVLLLNTIILALSVTGVTVLAAWAAALCAWMYAPRAAPWLLLGVIPLVAVPPYIHALVWLSLDQLVGRILGHLGFWGGAPSGMASAIWVEWAAYTPLAFGCLLLGLRAIDPDLLDAARLSRSDVGVLFRTALPLTSPALLTAGGIIFLFSLLDYGIPSLLQVRVYALEIFADFSATGNVARALGLAIPLLGIGAGSLVFLLEPILTFAFQHYRGGLVWVNPPSVPAWFNRAVGFLTGAILFQAALPLAVMIEMSPRLKDFSTIITEAMPDILFSLKISTTAGLICLPAAAVIGRALLQPSPWRKGAWFVLLLPLALPPSLVGIMLIQLTKYWPASRAFLPVWVNVFRFLPLAVLLVTAHLRTVDPLLLESAMVFQPSWRRRLFFINLPLASPGLLAGLGCVVSLAMGELAATLLVVPPGSSTLILRIYNYLHFGASQTVASLCLALSLTVLLAGGVMTLVVLWWSKITRSSEALG